MIKISFAFFQFIIYCKFEENTLLFLRAIKLCINFGLINAANTPTLYAASRINARVIVNNGG